ncbi:BEN domain-containing protein 5-like [Triplophysa dalaica]|uniref:BEN domain-containing protein 5-like n=1 Tax=Triplophysa dalaica TaxID=1582913 RepID=UPI0024E0341C|nr:BEN domain-containing protein 5-like [Triplophysa dalaica]
MRRKENPLFENNSNKRKEDFSDSEDSDDGAVVPKKIHEDLDKKYRFQKKQKHQLQEELMECKKRHAELEKINKDLVAELTTYRQLNVTLQQNINEVLQRAFSKTHDSSFFEVSETSSSLPEKGTPERQTSDKLPNTSGEIYERKNGKIHVGENVWLREEVWKKIRSSAKDSLFVKEMAVALWGTATLKNKSVSGNECPTNKNPVKPPLTPSKLQVLRVCFSDWLRTKEPEKNEREKRENRVGYYISQKIQDIIKKEQRNEKV